MSESVENRYDYELNFEDQRIVRIFSQIVPGSTVLEFGSADGAMTRYMKEILGCQVYIVEIDEEAFSRAIVFAEGGICGDLDKLNFQEAFKGLTFDIVLMADVLEHLKNPERILREVNELLTPNGHVIISIPNVAYSGLIMGLVQNSFVRTDTGLLDRTHAQFFTRESILSLLQKNGWKAIFIKGYLNDPLNSEFAQFATQEPAWIMEYLQDRVEGNVYQYLVIVVKDAYYREYAATMLLEKETDYAKHFTRLYCDTGTGFSEQQVIVSPISTEETHITFSLPDIGEITQLRWDPIKGRMLFCYGVYLSCGGLKIEPKYNNASLNINGGYIFLSKEPQFTFDTHGLPLKILTIHYKIEICYTNDVTQWMMRTLSQEMKEKMQQEIVRTNELQETREQMQQEIVRTNEWQETREQMQQELDLLKEKNDDLYKNLQQITNTHISVVDSRAWRITWPLRYAGSIIKKYLLKNASVSLKAESKSTGVKFENSILTPTDSPPPLVDIVVSFIIPSYNGGSDLAMLLCVLFAQKSLAEIEVIVVDSGSVDNGPDMAENLGAKVIHIPNEEFSHSHARNIGAKHAKGEYLIFITQDALPSGQYWARRMIEPLLNDKAVAASCIEVPRNDAHLYAKCGNWAHNRFFGFSSGDFIGALPTNEANYESLRKNAQLNDVACVIKTDVFWLYRYRGAYAEDLDLGLRIIRDGGKIALLSSEHVIHSHNRPMFYHFKRALVDSYWLKKIIPEYEIANFGVGQTETKSKILSEIIHGYWRICLFREIFLAEMENVKDRQDVFSISRSSIQQACGVSFDKFTSDWVPPASNDLKLDEVIEELYKMYKEQPNIINIDLSSAFKYYINDYICPYLEQNVQVIDKQIQKEIVESVFNFYAATVGQYLAGYINIAIEKDELTNLANQYMTGV